MTVIADSRDAIALAGVMGGEATAVGNETRNIYLEAAFWWPAAIAGRARRYNFSTDASHRFERGVDFVQPQSFAVVVKDTPEGRPSAGTGRQGGCRWH